MTHHLHLAGVIPNVGPDNAVGACHPFHFANCLCLVRNEIYDKTGHGRVEGGVSNRQFLRITNLKGCAPIGHLVACESDTKPSEGSTPVT
jgi:hypothetical protein